MIKASDIVSRLINIVPRLTNLFSDTVAISSLTRTGGTVTAATVTPHGLVTGNYVNIVGAQAPIEITALTSADEIASATTTDPHDLTKSPDETYTPTIKVVGADQSEYNGNALTLLSVPNRFSFTYQITGSPASPATGDLILLFDGKERGYNGKKQITVVDLNTFTYSITGTPLSPAIGTITAQKSHRITAAVSVERFMDAYTKQATQDKLWACVVLGNTAANKDRQVFSDAVYTATQGVEFQQRLISPFNVFVVTKSTGEIAGRSARDLMVDVSVIFFKALLRFKPPKILVNPNPMGVYFIEHDQQEYALAYYLHRFTFGTLCDVTEDDLLNDENVAFRDVDLTLNNNPDEPIINEVNLDDNPI